MLRRTEVLSKPLTLVRQHLLQRREKFLRHSPISDKQPPKPHPGNIHPRLRQGWFVRWPRRPPNARVLVTPLTLAPAVTPKETEGSYLRAFALSPTG